jgi:hypothetical protein
MQKVVSDLDDEATVAAALGKTGEEPVEEVHEEEIIDRIT